MSTPFPKGKEKRPRSSSEPNKSSKSRSAILVEDGQQPVKKNIFLPKVTQHSLLPLNESFVKNVTSRMSGLLPATITKWFSSPSSSNTNGSAQVADATDSSTEDEAPESPITMQPPAKKIRYNSPGELNQHVPVETRCTSTNTESIDEAYTVISPIGRSNTQKEKMFASTRVHSANEETTEETTQDTFFKQQDSFSAKEHSVDKRRKSLFGTPQDDSYKKHNSSKSANVRDPYFKPSLLSSPFYVGRTMYGGATSSYLSSPSFKKKTISLTNETSNNDSVTMSHSARRVMDLLEHYSSPLIEAKRIPQITRDPEKHSPNNMLQQSVKPDSSKAYSYKTQELYVPSIARILTIKRKSRLMDTTSAARQIIASHSSSSEFLPYPKTNSGGDASDEAAVDKMTTKIKSRLTRTNRDRNIEMEHNIDTVNLPNVILQIDKDNLPKFTSQPSQSSSIQTPVIITPEALKKTSESDNSDISKLKNAEKDRKVEAKTNNDHFKSTFQKFSFSCPESNIDSVNKLKDDELISKTSNQIVLDKNLSVAKCSDWKCMDCWVMNKADVNKCVCCGGTKPVDSVEGSKKCSVCDVSLKQSQGDKCTECEKKINNINKSLVAKEASTIKWKCDNCWIDNSESADKCVCCGTKNPKKTPASVTKSEIFVENEWKCNDCWIKNKNSVTKCAACGGSKPGSQAISQNKLDNDASSKSYETGNKIKQNTDSTFKSIAKSQSEKWECPLCLVRNESSRDTCICCEANKPGSEKESQTKFNFHQPSEITFKFGIQPENQAKCTNIEPEECNMGDESETNNNILPKTSTFNFGLPVKKFGDQSEPMNKLAECPKINFTFGIPKQNQTSPVRNTIFGLSNKSDETAKSIEEKPQEVPQVFPSPQLSIEPLKKNSGLFNIPVPSQIASEIPARVPFPPVNQNSTIKKDAPFLSTSVVPTTTSEAKTQQNNFGFPSVMPSTNLFATAPTTTTSISNILPTPLSMSVPASTTVSMFQNPNIVTTQSSFFQKSDALPSVGVSLFSKTESTRTTSSILMSTTQPVFSFGGQGSVPQTEKFSFNLSSNKSDPAAIFKPPSFGVTSDNNISSNKFNPPSNSIIGGNTLPGCSINATTQMNTTNALTTGNSLTTPSGSSIFGATVPKENIWSPNTNNMFATNTTTNGDPKPPAFTFGTTQFNTNNAPFGSTTQQTQPNNALFGSTAQQTQPNNTPFGGTAQQAQSNNAPFGSTAQQAQQSNVPFGGTGQQAQTNNTAFGSTTQQTQPNNAAFGTTQQVQPTPPSQNIFGIANQTTTSQLSMFGNHLQSQSAPSIFGGVQVPSNPMGMFGASNSVVGPTFGTLNPTNPTFETPSLPPPLPAPPSFNFGGQQSNVIFGFGQQQQPNQVAPQPENQPGMYGFGGPAAPQMQFTIGSAPNTTVRRVRKAMRRTQR